MAKGIYVSATTPGSGKSLIALGLADTLHRHADRIGFFKPVVNGHDAASDPMVALMKARFNLDDERCRGGLTFPEVRSLLAEGKREEIDSRCVEIFAEMARHCDVVIVEGTDLTGQDAAVEFDLNARLANNLAAPVVAVVGAKGRTVAEAVDAVEVARKELVAERCTLLAIMVNRADPEDLEAIAAAVRPGASGRPVYVLPELEEIARPTTGEVAAALGIGQVAGLADLERDVRSVKVAAMSVANFLHVLDDGALVIVPGDRADVLVACLASSFSPEFPVPVRPDPHRRPGPGPHHLLAAGAGPVPDFRRPGRHLRDRQAGLRGAQRDLVRAPPQGGLGPGPVGPAGGRGGAAGAAAPAAAGADDAAALPARPDRAGPLRAPAHRAAGGQRTSASCAPRRSCTAATSAT